MIALFLNQKSISIRWILTLMLQRNMYQTYFHCMENKYLLLIWLNLIKKKKRNFDS